jgi:hypothetical protein
MTIRLGTLTGRTPILALMTSLGTSDDWTHWHKLNRAGQILRLFIAHRSLIELLRGSPEVLGLDCTYKTNRYRMPLFAITGVSTLGATFHMALVFLGQEWQGNYA